MYFASLGGLKKDIKKALKSGDPAKLQKALAAEQKKLDKNPNSKKAAKRADYVSQLSARLTEVSAPAVVEAPTVPAIVTPPAPVSAPPSASASPLPAVAPPAPSAAPPPAAESFAMPLAPAPSMFGPTSLAPAPMPDTTAPAAPAPESKTPLILGAAGLGLLALMFLGKKKGR